MDGRMKVLQNTPQKLVLEDRPVLVLMLFFTAILVFCGAGLSALPAGDVLTGLGLASVGLVAGGMGFFVVLERVLSCFDRAPGTEGVRRVPMVSSHTIGQGAADVAGIINDWLAGRGG